MHQLQNMTLKEPVQDVIKQVDLNAPASKHDTKRTRKRSSSSKSNKNRPPAPVSISSRVNDSKVQYVIKQVDLNATTTCEAEILGTSRSLVEPTRVDLVNVDHGVVDQDSSLGRGGICAVDMVNVEHGLVDQDGSLGHGGTSTVDMANVEHGSIDQGGSLGFSQKHQLQHGPVNMEQVSLTGRRGEELAFNYYKNKGIKIVKWVNEARETGLPYDIKVCDDENRKEYIEVKTTNSKRKDWFEISVNEWQFAVKKGESFSIARVVLLGDKQARVTVFKNPARLCQLGQLKLAVLMSEKQKDEFVLC
ncbi:uncharacterized protein LOC143543383 [Bidens hawaiensis]|uniref:uncharacterized protein LOC143543383 n=1 Tax=Bidens hawaiensis TaxID=980011 RepID=UPI00404AE4E8